MAGDAVGPKDSNFIGLLDRAFSPSNLRRGFLLAHFREVRVNSLFRRSGKITGSFEQRIALAQDRPNSHAEADARGMQRSVRRGRDALRGFA